jgi:hypothetical protein
MGEESNGEPNLFFDWNGSAFVSIEDTGIQGTQWSLATSAVDLNRDNRSDIHIANDYNEDVVYTNRGNNRFQRVEPGNATNRNGMASEVFDATGDGQPDVFIANIYLPVSKENISESRYRNFRSLFENVLDERARGNNLLVFCGTDFDSDPCDLAPEYGIRKGGWGWAAVAADFDNDGDDDLFHTTQTVLRVNRSDPHYTYPMVWLREGDKFTTLNASATGFEETDGRGVVGFDYDIDGDIDLLVATHGGRYVLYENCIESRNSLEIVLRRPGPGSPIGAEVEIVT